MVVGVGGDNNVARSAFLMAVVVVMVGTLVVALMSGGGGAIGTRERKLVCSFTRSLVRSVAPSLLRSLRSFAPSLPQKDFLKSEVCGKHTSFAKNCK